MKITFHFLFLLTLSALAFGVDHCVAAEGPAKDYTFFEKKIRPLLVKHCYECHSASAGENEGGLYLDSRQGWKTGGDSGPSIVPGKPKQSLLIKAIGYKDPDLQMPPDGKLSAVEIKALKKWIIGGASDPRKGKSAKHNKSPKIDLVKARQFWSFQKPKKHKAPKVANTKWAKDDLDRFILARLEAKGLQPAPQVSREKLIRRLYFDLIGLPPTRKQIAFFVNNKHPLAVERLVDRLLASKQFGERWGRHWLDVARFAETSGGGRSLIFKNAWRYRDYVIDAFNNDKPYNEFVQQQICGDLLPFNSPEQRREQIIASGFLSLGPTNYELQDKETLRVEVVDEQIDTIGRTFLGMTIGCARCHDHKFDPIPTKDYYALAGILGSTKSLVRGNVSKFIERQLPRIKNNVEYDKLVQSTDALKKQVQEHKQRKLQLAQIIKKRSPNIAVAKKDKPRAVAQLPGVVVDDVHSERKGTWYHSTFSPNHVGKGYLHDKKEKLGSKSITFRPNLTKAGQYEVFIAYNAAPSRASKVPVTILHAQGEKKLYLNQRRPPQNDQLFYSLGQYRFDKGTKGSVTLSNKAADGYVIADAVQFLPIELPKKIKKKQPLNRTIKLSTAAKKQLSQTRTELAKLSNKIKQLEKVLKKQQSRLKGFTEKAMSVQEETKPSDWHLLIRGVVRNRGPLVPRGFLSVVETTNQIKIPKNESGRRQLATWLTSRENPLPSRVIVNRLWHHLFGKGLVPTTDNFGATGQQPSHPKLLDTLAVDFMNDHWSMKRLIRRIVLSKSYQMSVIDNSRAKLLDPQNHLIWSRNRRRLEAEVIRDSMLLISGQLDQTAGGSTYRGKSEYGYQFNSRRRSVYVPVLRNARHDLFSVFDFPNPNLVVGHRTTSVVSTQALYFMNSPFVQQQSNQAAKELLKNNNQSNQARLVRVYFEVLGRKPSSVEKKIIAEYLSDQSISAEQRWTQIYHVLFASIDFRYVN